MIETKRRILKLIKEAEEQFTGTGKALLDIEDYVAEYLTANGVIVPPYKVGQVVYVLRSRTSNGKNLYLREERISHYRIFGAGSFMCFESERMSVGDYLWGNVFLTREEAEKALERSRG